MNALIYTLRLTIRNLKQTWATQIMTTLTVSLSVFIFSFFLLIYLNCNTLSNRIGDDVRIVVYFEKEPASELLSQLKKEVNVFTEVEQFVYVSREEAFGRLKEKLGPERDIVNDLDPSFLPPSIEISPRAGFNNPARLKELSKYLSSFPGVIKVQYAHDWIERFHYVINLFRIIVTLSAALLIFTTIFMVSYAVRFAIYKRQEELEILRLLGATTPYIRDPFLVEGVIQGLFGSGLAILALYFLFRWAEHAISGPDFLNWLSFSFLPPIVLTGLIVGSIILCIVGSTISMRQSLRT